MGSIAPVIGLSLANAQISRRAALLVDALQLRCTLHDIDQASDPAHSLALILTDRVAPTAIADIVRRHPDIPVLVIGTDGGQEAAIDAMRAGAADYLWSARCDSEIVARIARQLGCSIVAQENPAEDAPDHGWVGGSVEARRVRDVVTRVARSNTTILIEGETGTGKDVIALALHRQSRRAVAPIVPINCAAIPETLIEGELFGYARGAFTGASQAYAGKFREADGGTLFLDEVGELSASAQAKLLRAIETREVSPLGSTKRIPLDVRIVAATNRDLARQVADGRFRSDLYYRLAVVRIALPPLRNRRADIAPIAHALLDRICAENGLARPMIDADFTAHLAQGDWFGNVRELRNALEHAAVTTPDPSRLSIADLPELVARPVLRRRGDDPQDERGLLLRALATTDGRKAAAARSLNCSRMTLYRRLERAGIDDSMIAAWTSDASHMV